MSITSAKTGATGISLALENNFMEPIASTLVGSGGANTVIFNDIPQGYKHLQIRGISRPSEAGAGGSQYIYFRVNSDSGTNYSRHSIYGAGSVAVQAGVSDNQIRAGFQMRDGYPANIFAATIIDILDYANTNKNKTIRSLNGFDSNGSGSIVGLNSGAWLNTSAITSIQLTCEVGDFIQYSRFSLYGIKG